MFFYNVIGFFLAVMHLMISKYNGVEPTDDRYKEMPFKVDPN